MPPGAKKRRAAKKKQEKVANIHSPTTSLQGSDDLKPLDEKGSDGGEVNSPTSQDHNHQLGQQEEEEEEKRDSLSFGSATKPMEGSQNGGEVVRDLKPDDVAVTTAGDSESGVISIEYVELVKESSGSGSSSDSMSSSGSSSDDESRPVEKKEESQLLVLEETVEVLDGENCNSVNEMAPPVDPIEQVVLLSEEVTCDPVEQVVSLSEEVIQVVEVTPAEENGNSVLIDLPSKESEEKILPASEISNGSKHPKESATPEISDNQQRQVASAPLTVQPTSWKSCCGLFDVLIGSNR